MVAALAKALDGALPIIGVGGILSGADAKEKIDAGATLVQIYTGLIYRGPDLVAECARALATPPGASDRADGGRCLRDAGFAASAIRTRQLGVGSVSANDAITLPNARSMSGAASTSRARSVRKRSASSSAFIDSAFSPCRFVKR